MKTNRNLLSEIRSVAESAKEASRELASVKTDVKNQVLADMAKELVKSRLFILKANERDLKNVKKLKLSQSFIERLDLSEKKIEAMAESVREVARFEDPVGTLEKLVKRPNGLLIGKLSLIKEIAATLVANIPGIKVFDPAFHLRLG